MNKIRRFGFLVTIRNFRRAPVLLWYQCFVWVAKESRVESKPLHVPTLAKISPFSQTLAEEEITSLGILELVRLKSTFTNVV